MRDVIQKEYKEEELLDAARVLFGLGWKSVKLYFMLGLPGETEEDLRGIVDLSRKVSAIGKHRRKVTASVSTFVPKPHTPFQWAAQVDLEETEARQNLLRHELRRAGIQFKWHEARLSFLEGVFARGDRRLAGPLLSAYRLGCRFDGWTDQFRLDLWQQAFAEHGIDPSVYLRRRLLDEPLPWDHLSSGVTKKWLQRDLAKAFEGILTPDCSVERCSYCGACDFKSVRNVTYHLNGAKGAEHRGLDVDSWAREVLPEQDNWGTRQWQVMQEKKQVQGSKLKVQGSKFKVQSSKTKTPDPGLRTQNPGLASGNAEEWLAGDPNTIAVSTGDTKASVARLRVMYSRLGEARFLGTREIVTMFTRALRRAKLPVAYSQGFHPAPKLSFGPALPLGMESEEEFLDIFLSEVLEPSELVTRLDAELPDGFSLQRAEAIALKAASIDASIQSTQYHVALASLPVDKQQASFLAQRLDTFHAAATFPLQKRNRNRTKIMEAKECVQQVALITSETLRLDIAVTPMGTLNPPEFLKTLLDLSADETKVLRVTKIQTQFHSQPAVEVEVDPVEDGRTGTSVGPLASARDG